MNDLLTSLILALCLAQGCAVERTPESDGQDITADGISATSDAPVMDSDVASPEDVLPVTRHAGCKPAEELDLGTTIPWRGFDHEGTAYTCNTCRGGLADLQGTWRILDFDTEDPDVAITDAWVQTFSFDGNTWRQRATWQSNGRTNVEMMEGWYWCSSKPEVNNETKVFVVTELNPANAFGYDEGYVFTTDLLVSTEKGDKLAFWFYDGFNSGDQLAEVYCRVGSDVTTLAGETKPCVDPFEE